MLKRLLPLLKAAWLILVIITVCAYIFRNVDTIVTLLREIPIERLLMSVSLALIGRLLIAQLARVATSNIGWLPSYRDMLYMMGTSELGKYLPGGVWHFLGRAAYYRSANLPATDLTQALIFENLSLVLSALLAGSCFLISYAHIPLMNKLLLISVVILIWFCILWIMLRQQENLKSLPILKLFLLQWAIWLAFSLSFIFVLPDIAYQDNLFLALGAFPIGWLLGFLTPFAPGGVGTREIVLIALLLPSFGSETTLVFVAFHRLLWVILELLLGLFVIVWGRTAV
jgi:hypothetical protein